MPKKVRISIDAGANYFDIPGGEADFNATVDEADDTIFGQTFRSTEIGLISWVLSANGIYKGFAGYLAEIKKQGTSTAMTSEAMSLLSGKTFQIDDTTKRIIDRDTAYTVFDNAVDETANVDNIDFLFGKVTFKASYTVNTPVTITGNYFPTVALAKANTFTLTQTAEAVDNTDFGTAQGNGGFKTSNPGLRTVTCDLGGFFDATEDFRADLATRAELIIEVDAAGDGLSIARGFFKLASAATSGAVGAEEEETLTFNLTVPFLEDPALAIPYGWAHDPTTTLPQGIQDALDQWEAESKPEVQYLPQGAIGQTPLDGAEGDAVITDVTLAGNISGINEFTVNFQGDGAYTVV